MKLLEYIKTYDIKTIQELLARKEITIQEYNKKYKDKTKQLAKNLIISNLLTWTMEDPRRSTFAKMYLEAYDRLFFVEKGVNNDNDGIIINFIDKSGLLDDNS